MGLLSHFHSSLLPAGPLPPDPAVASTPLKELVSECHYPGQDQRKDSSVCTLLSCKCLPGVESKLQPGWQGSLRNTADRFLALVTWGA